MVIRMRLSCRKWGRPKSPSVPKSHFWDSVLISWVTMTSIPLPSSQKKIASNVFGSEAHFLHELLQDTWSHWRKFPSGIWIFEDKGVWDLFPLTWSNRSNDRKHKSGVISIEIIYILWYVSVRLTSPHFALNVRKGIGMKYLIMIYISRLIHIIWCSEI